MVFGVLHTVQIIPAISTANLASIMCYACITMTIIYFGLCVDAYKLLSHDQKMHADALKLQNGACANKWPWVIMSCLLYTLLEQSL